MATTMNDAAELTTNNRFDAVDAETLEVLKGRVCETSRNSYESKNIAFLVWIFDNREDHGTRVRREGERRFLDAVPSFNSHELI